ncbi:hypothetical protein NEOC84_001022|nr:hypothetical protein [Neochlamydia sp. AcF84]
MLLGGYMMPSVSFSNTQPNFRLAVSENIEDAVSGKLMTRAVTVFPCGHTLNEDTVIQCLARNKLCPLDSQLIERHTPNPTIRLHAQIAETEFLSEFFRERYIALLIHLLNEPSIKAIPSLASLLENQSKTLMSQLGEQLTQEEMINYKWTKNLLDENKKVRLFVFKRLQQSYQSSLSTPSLSGTSNEIECYPHPSVSPLSMSSLYSAILQIHFPSGDGSLIKQAPILDKIYEIEPTLSTEEKVAHIFQKIFTLEAFFSPPEVERNSRESKTFTLSNYCYYLLNISRLLLWHHLPGGRKYLNQPLIQALPLKSKAELLIPCIKEYYAHLNYLNLNSLSFICLPPEIGQLSQLRQLYLQDNQLTTLPAAIGQLSQLQRLYLYNNYLNTLPENIGQLSQLKELFLSNNRLSALPESIGQLCQLQYLFLSTNQLRALPKSSGQLSQLRLLYLDNNQLTSLPKVIGQFSQLQQLNLSNNPFTTIPPFLKSEEIVLHKKCYLVSLQEDR